LTVGLYRGLRAVGREFMKGYRRGYRRSRYGEEETS
jgi:hypothetical protein